MGNPPYRRPRGGFSGQDEVGGEGGVPIPIVRQAIGEAGQFTERALRRHGPHLHGTGGPVDPPQRYLAMIPQGTCGQKVRGVRGSVLEGPSLRDM